MEPFTFIIPDTEGKTVTEILTTTIEFQDEIMVVVENYYADWKDQDLGTTDNQLRKDTYSHLRNKITGCCKHWYCKTKVWGVEINLMGVAVNITVCFKRESQAQELCDALIKWLLK